CRVLQAWRAFAALQGRLENRGALGILHPQFSKLFANAVQCLCCSAAPAVARTWPRNRQGSIFRSFPGATRTDQKQRNEHDETAHPIRVFYSVAGHSIL